ncbi:Neutral protease 2 like protein [Verticillium longisporum]|uniref:Neutral protease 2 n=3 Tax=Verticillium TaxID=1036719 RepID=G2XCZ8_VERDV|nr:metalloproteinase [Verticillium dahliae VdLs.17]KAG7143348.1 Neutral protease 2 like protein [Verticillium longisporum]KAH6706761.1 metallo proteinase [Verticillium dahliae]EGY16866.1 metalloproteinase [Verticillium dahliae VdLs.17]PNH27858.1 hypothetical protein BJF96_g8815 [Verticillium dahliae]PNH41002.1 hypothetical protein VD0004_g6069 [Verticillium dahliae]
MKFSGLLYLATLASAASVDLSKRDSPLDIKIEKVGNTVIKASITNTGASDLKVLKTGSILDELEVEKSEIFSGSKKVEFDGVRLQLDTTALSEESFQVLVAGETVELTWDVAHVHDLSAGGEFDISANGRFSYAESDSTELTGVATYASNVVHSTVDGEEAAKVRRDFHETIKRAVVQSDCTGTRRTATINALSNCRSLALAAASAASSGAAAKMTDFFKSSTTATRNTVAGVFNRIASECGSSTGGVSRQYCTDIYPACSSGVIAYTLPSQSYMVNCPYYFSSFPAQSRTCRAIDQATTTLHEVTHLTQIRGTQDYNCYGYSCVRSLSASQNINHADTYTLFAQSIYAGC